jgi:NADP-dependent 3-hydroxy acid dehydrogenase YdfG
MLLNSDMHSKVVAIAGACSPAGACTARSLATKGAMLMLGDQSLSELHALVARIAEEGGCAQYRAADPARQASIDMLVDHTLDAYGRIDLLLNLGAELGQPLVERAGIGRGRARPSAQSTTNTMDSPPRRRLLQS